MTDHVESLRVLAGRIHIDSQERDALISAGEHLVMLAGRLDRAERVIAQTRAWEADARTLKGEAPRTASAPDPRGYIIDLAALKTILAGADHD